MPTRRTSSAGSANIQVGVVDQGNFDNFYRNNYDPSLASNQYTVNTIAGTPDTYEIRDGGGALLQSGDYVAGNKILQRAGADPVAASGGTAQNFVLDPPQNNNILDGMSDFITALRDPNITPNTFQLKVADATTHMKNARQNMDQGLGVGSRLNSLEQVMGSNEGLSTLNQQARAKVSEADLYEVIATLSKRMRR